METLFKIPGIKHRLSSNNYISVCIKVTKLGIPWLCELTSGAMFQIYSITGVNNVHANHVW